MTEGFSRTLQTASEAEATARMLERVATGRGAIAWQDIERLKALAERYTDYAAALPETAADPPAEPEPEQGALL